VKLFNFVDDNEGTILISGPHYKRCCAEDDHQST